MADFAPVQTAHDAIKPLSDAYSAAAKGILDAQASGALAVAAVQAADDPAVAALQQQLADLSSKEATDLAAAKSYYCDVLGFPLVGEIADSIFVRCGDLNLIIQRSDNPRRGRTVYFDGDGRVHEATAALKALGTTFTEEPRRIATMPDGTQVWLGFFDDPWGNPFGLLCNMPAPGVTR